MWFLVQTAQQVAASAAKEGALVSDVDAVARDVIAGKGLDKYLTHRLTTASGVIYRNNYRVGIDGPRRDRTTNTQSPVSPWW